MIVLLMTIIAIAFPLILSLLIVGIDDGVGGDGDDDDHHQVW